MSRTLNTGEVLAPYPTDRKIRFPHKILNVPTVDADILKLPGMKEIGQAGVGATANTRQKLNAARYRAGVAN